MFRFPLLLGGSHFLELFLAHGFLHLLGRATQAAFGFVSSFGGEGSPGCLLLCF